MLTCKFATCNIRQLVKLQGPVLVLICLMHPCIDFYNYLCNKVNLVGIKLWWDKAIHMSLFPSFPCTFVKKKHEFFSRSDIFSSCCRVNKINLPKQKFKGKTKFRIRGPFVPGSVGRFTSCSPCRSSSCSRSRRKSCRSRSRSLEKSKKACLRSRRGTQKGWFFGAPWKVLTRKALTRKALTRKALTRKALKRKVLTRKVLKRKVLTRKALKRMEIKDGIFLLCNMPLTFSLTRHW